MNPLDAGAHFCRELSTELLECSIRARRTGLVFLWESDENPGRRRGRVLLGPCLLRDLSFPGAWGSRDGSPTFWVALAVVGAVAAVTTIAALAEVCAVVLYYVVDLRG